MAGKLPALTRPLLRSMLCIYKHLKGTRGCSSRLLLLLLRRRRQLKTGSKLLLQLLLLILLGAAL